MLRNIAFTLVLALAALAAPPVAAEDLPIKAFFGTWSGSAIANNRDSLYFGVTVRDIDVTIAPTAGGFHIVWTTVLRRGGTRDNPKIRRKSTSLTFTPSANKGVYSATDAAAPKGGRNITWARLAGNTLTVYLMDIDAKGRYAISSYARTLAGATMELKFRLIKDGDPVRLVKGKLVKQAD